MSALDLCNGTDDDCDAASADGSEDAALGQPCDNPADSDLCATGVSSCSGGALSCSDDAASTLDLCNGLDDDCNGGTADGSGDASVGSACDGPDTDACMEGLRVCSAGSLACSDATGDEVELCNGIDDDCDVAVDEGFDLSSDPNHCGDCLTACSNLCCSGGCTASSVTNCGACGHACVPGMLVITELMIDTSAVNDTQGEWFELYNPNSWDIDLRGFVIRDLNATPNTHTISSPQPVVIPASSYAVLGINADSATNGGVTVLYQYSSFALGNSGDEVILDAFGVELDRVVWAGTFDPLGASKELSRNHLDYLLNDDTTATGFWRAAVTVFGAGDRGTPGAVNDCSL
ncbi:MAG: lamin tail domain-containing protein [Myxococcales bacterium]|nr:lamin tail domain-containing protein [Myxococcales bacterium]